MNISMWFYLQCSLNQHDALTHIRGSRDKTLEYRPALLQRPYIYVIQIYSHLHYIMTTVVTLAYENIPSCLSYYNWLTHSKSDSQTVNLKVIIICIIVSFLITGN